MIYTNNKRHTQMLNLLICIMVALLLGYTIWQTVENYLNRVALGQTILRGRKRYPPHDM